MDPSRPPVAMQEMPQMVGGFPGYYDYSMSSSWPWASFPQMYSVPQAHLLNGQNRPAWYPEFSAASSSAPTVIQQAPVAAPPRSPLRPKRNKDNKETKDNKEIKDNKEADAKALAASVPATATAATATTTSTPTPPDAQASLAAAAAAAAAAASSNSHPSAATAQASSSSSRTPSAVPVAAIEPEAVYKRRVRVARSRKRSLTREEVLLIRPAEESSARVVAVQREFRPYVAEKKKDAMSFTAILNAASQSVIDQIEKLRDEYIHHQRTLAKLQTLRDEMGIVPAVAQEGSSRDSSPPVPEPVAAATTRRQRRQVQNITPVPAPPSSASAAPAASAIPTVPAPVATPATTPAAVATPPAPASSASRSRPATAEPEPEPSGPKERRTRNQQQGKSEKEEERPAEPVITSPAPASQSSEFVFASHARTDGTGRVYVCPQCRRCFSHGPAFSQHIRYHQRDAEQVSEANAEESPEEDTDERRATTRRSAQQARKRRR